MTGWGNLGRRGFVGLKPKPPYSGSNCWANSASPSRGRRPEQGENLPAARARESLAHRLCHRIRRLLDLLALLGPGAGHFSHDREETGGPGRSRGGKYVPPKNGRPSGVRNIDIGQPPGPRA